MDASVLDVSLTLSVTVRNW